MCRPFRSIMLTFYKQNVFADAATISKFTPPPSLENHRRPTYRLNARPPISNIRVLPARALLLHRAVFGGVPLKNRERKRLFRTTGALLLSKLYLPLPTETCASMQLLLLLGLL